MAYVRSTTYPRFQSQPGRPARIPGWFSNYARTAALMALLIALLALGGRVIGGADGMLLFGGVGLTMNFLMYWFSDRLALMAHRAQEVSVADAPGLHAMVAQLCARAGIPKPRVYVIPSSAANAFATGRNPRHAAIAVTEGIMHVLDKRQLQSVLAHELSHVKNRDVLIATIAAGVAGLIASIGYALQWGLMLGGAGAGRDDDGDRGGALAALAWIVVAPIIALLVQLAISRSREFGADSSGGRLSGDPEALAEALLTLEHRQEARPYEFAGPATAHLFIVNPLRGSAAKLMHLFSTHPPIEERVRRLRAMRTV